MRRFLAATGCALLASCQATTASVRELDRSRPELANLTASAVEVVAAAAGQLPTYAGCGHLVRDCLKVHPTCQHAAREVSLLAWLANSGASASEAMAEVQAYYDRFRQPAAAIDLAKAACQGPEDAAVTMVVFSDFECPACGTVRPLLEAVAASNPQVRLCFKYFPLDSHANSRTTAQAAEFAREQGRFWQLHDLMFEHQENLDLDHVVALAATAGLDAGLLRQALAENRYLAVVKGSKAEGKSIGITGTPTILLNGRPFTLPVDGNYLQRAIEDHTEFAKGGWTRD
ncbi:MAG: thioredoxin domain-containing protein [Myxococcales bacterium]